jgi:hypothetical protein
MASAQLGIRRGSGGAFSRSRAHQQRRGVAELEAARGSRARFAASRSPISRHRDHSFRRIAITDFGIAITDFGIVIGVFAGS